MPVPSTAYCYDFKILENEQVAPQMMRLRLECPELARSIEPGVHEPEGSGRPQ